MNKKPKEVDWSKQKPGTIGVTREGRHQFEFVASRDIDVVFHSDYKGLAIRTFLGRKWPDKDMPDDILLPWESCIAEGHNPDGLTNEQVGEVWRLLNVGERVRSPIQWRSDNKWSVLYYGCDFELYDQAIGTYRVPITPPVAKAPVGKATKRIPCGPEHFPPGTVVRTVGCSHWQAILWAKPSGLGAVGPSFILGEEKYDRLMLDGIERSTDFGKTWLPCYVEVEE